MNNCRIIKSIRSDILAAKFECPACRQSMITFDPEATFRHCGRVETLTPEQRAILAGDVDPRAAAEAAAVASHREAEKIANAKQGQWNPEAEFQAEVASMRLDAAARQDKVLEMEIHRLTVHTPYRQGRQPI